MTNLSQSKESALYIIDKIRPEIEKENFRGIYKYTQQLAALVRFAAIMQDRERVIPIIKSPEV